MLVFLTYLGVEPLIGLAKALLIIPPVRVEKIAQTIMNLHHEFRNEKTTGIIHMPRRVIN